MWVSIEWGDTHMYMYIHMYHPIYTIHNTDIRRSNKGLCHPKGGVSTGGGNCTFSSSGTDLGVGEVWGMLRVLMGPWHVNELEKSLDLAPPQARSGWWATMTKLISSSSWWWLNWRRTKVEDSWVETDVNWKGKLSGNIQVNWHAWSWQIKSLIGLILEPYRIIVQSDVE